MVAHLLTILTQDSVVILLSSNIGHEGIIYWVEVVGLFCVQFSNKFSPLFGCENKDNDNITKIKYINA